jgi:hypothetical protein
MERAAARALALADAEAAAAEGTLLAGVGVEIAAVALPVIAVVAVGVALGAPYLQAREAAKKEETVSGFSHGFIMGLLEWKWEWAVRLFPGYFPPNPYDPAMAQIRALAYLNGMQTGFLAGASLPRAAKKLYLLKLHTLVTTSKVGWTARSDAWQEQMRARRVQISYVIDLAVAARKYGIIKDEVKLTRPGGVSMM